MKFEQAREKYKPQKIKYLLVAETPPKSNSNRFFYFENIDRQDSLFIETIKVLFPSETENIEAKEIRKKKRYFLQKFKNNGFFLIDSLDQPFEQKFTSRQKINFIEKGQRDLLRKIQNLADNETKVILIAAPVYKANFKFLQQNGINVINNQLIEFPGSGGQKKYREKMNLLINK